MKVKNTFIVIGAVVISLTIGLAIPLAFSPHNEGVSVDNELIKSRTTKQFEEDLIKTYHAKAEEKQMMDIMETEATKGQVENGNEEEKVNRNSTPKQDKVPEQPAEYKNSSERVVKDQSIQGKINENRDKISEEDLYKGAAIYNSLDTGYLFGLAEGGLTEEEKFQAQTYLSANLNSEQYAIAKELYFKYAGLLNGE
jgi:hypothetical protein